MSVEKTGKLLNIPKLEKPEFLGNRPKNNKEWEILENYNLRDSEISKKYLNFLVNSFEELGATHKNTIASTSMSLFRNKYLNKKYYRHHVEDLDEIFKAYYGGRTEAFCRGNLINTEQKENQIKYNYYDFNSLYPSVMFDNEFPDPNSVRLTKKNVLYYIKEFQGVSEVDIFCPIMKYPLLPYKYKNKLMFPTGSFRGFYSHIELRKAIELGYTIKKVHKTFYYKETCRPFKEFVSDLYAKRLKYKTENNPMQEVCKLLLNSCYGKFGQKYRDKDNIQPFNQTKEELNQLKQFERVGDFIRIKKEFTEPASFCIPIWALYVTAYGRLKLHDTILKTNPVYVDTDSILTLKEMECSNKLGCLKLERKIIEGMVVKPKMYALIDDENIDYVKIKGIAKKFNFLEFKGFLTNPETRYFKFMKFKESIRRGFIPNEIQEISKTLSLEDEKRVWEKPFNLNEFQDSMPINLIDGIDEREVFEELYIEEQKNLNINDTFEFARS